jgi:hypothetical protein
MDEMRRELELKVQAAAAAREQELGRRREAAAPPGGVSPRRAMRGVIIALCGLFILGAGAYLIQVYRHYNPPKIEVELGRPPGPLPEVAAEHPSGAAPGPTPAA